MIRPADAWICDSCGYRIHRKDAGFIELYNQDSELGRVGAYPQPRVNPAQPGAGPVNAMEALRHLHRLGIRALHDRCEDKSSEGYTVEVNAVDTLEKWTIFAIQVAEKSWIAKEDIVRLLLFWWANRKIQPPQM